MPIPIRQRARDLAPPRALILLTAAAVALTGVAGQPVQVLVFLVALLALSALASALLWRLAWARVVASAGAHGEDRRRRRRGCGRERSGPLKR